MTSESPSVSAKVPLPIDQKIIEIQNAVKLSSSLVLLAEPGAGKTTRLPPALLSLTSKKILVLEPRRIAAVSAASRIAEENGWSLGEEVGFQVRFESQCTSRTRLIFLTEALLVKKMIGAEPLNDIGIVVLDEFHERSVHTDLALGMLREMQILGSEIRIVVMSATLDPLPISKFLGDVPIVRVPGREFPLSTFYLSQKMELNGVRWDWVLMARKVFEAHTQLVTEAEKSKRENRDFKTKSDLLVFLPGLAEIHRLYSSLELEVLKMGDPVDLRILHGSLPLSEQRQLLKSSVVPRIILSTNVAESAVTIEGIGGVFDFGLAKTMRFQKTTGFSRLETTRISKASAKQRAGRAGRQGPGLAFKWWSQSEEGGFQDQEIPEIQRVDLTQQCLFLAAYGVKKFADFSWYEKPSSAALDSAHQNLIWKSLLSVDGELTEFGRMAARMPIDPTLAMVLKVSEHMGEGPLGAEIAAVLSEAPQMKSKDGSGVKDSEAWNCDIVYLLHVLSGKIRDPVVAASLNRRNIEKTRNQLMEWVSLGPRNREPWKVTNAQVVKKILLHSFSDRLCRTRIDGFKAILRGGRGVQLMQSSQASGSDFFVALNGIDKKGLADTQISLACGFDERFVMEEFKREIIERKSLRFDSEKKRVVVSHFKGIDGLAFSEERILPVKNEDGSEILRRSLLENFDEFLKGAESLNHWMKKWDWLKSVGVEKMREAKKYDLLIDEILESKTELLLEKALLLACYGKSTWQEMYEVDLSYFFDQAVSESVLEVLKKELPNQFHLPNGKAVPIQYDLDRLPFVEMKLQDAFGVRENPMILFSTQALVFQLLAPNYRPVQITADIAGFWNSSYLDIRKQLRGRYPKHKWPENP